MEPKRQTNFLRPTNLRQGQMKSLMPTNLKQLHLQHAVANFSAVT